MVAYNGQDCSNSNLVNAIGQTGVAVFNLGDSGDDITCTEIFITSVKWDNATDRVSFEASATL